MKCNGEPMRFKVAAFICFLMLTSATPAEVLYLDNQPASAVAVKINQVNRKQIRFADPAAAKKIINGRFMTDHPASFVRALKSIYRDIQVTETKDGWIVATRKKR